MYLSKIILNTGSAKVRRDLSNCYELHRTILRAFPGENQKQNEVRAKYQILYRLEQNNREQRPIILLQSNINPNWETMDDSYFFQDIDISNPMYKYIGDKYANFHKGMSLKFLIKANPSIKVGTTTKAERIKGEKNNGRRVFLIKEQDQVDWLKRKGQQFGFEIRNVSVNGNEKLVGYKKNNNLEQKNKITTMGVIYTGILEIVQSDLFVQGLKSGIGPGKSFGCGLLSIAPVR